MAPSATQVPGPFLLLQSVCIHVYKGDSKCCNTKEPLLIFSTFEGEVHVVDCKTADIVRSHKGLTTHTVTAMAAWKREAEQVLLYNSENQVVLLDVKKQIITNSFKAVTKKEKGAKPVSVATVS